jgi:hypothetical protein
VAAGFSLRQLALSWLKCCLHHEASKPARPDDKFIEIDVFVDRKFSF